MIITSVICMPQINILVFKCYQPCQISRSNCHLTNWIEILKDRVSNTLSSIYRIKNQTRVTLRWGWERIGGFKSKEEWFSLCSGHSTGLTHVFPGKCTHAHVIIFIICSLTLNCISKTANYPIYQICIHFSFFLPQ